VIFKLKVKKMQTLKIVAMKFDEEVLLENESKL